MRPIHWGVLIVTALLLLGCGSVNKLLGSQNANVAGTWDATMTVTGGTEAPANTQFTAVFTLAQSGTNVTGTFASSTGLSGQIEGSVSGEDFSLGLLQGAPCLGSFSGSATSGNSDTQLSGAYSGSDCNGTIQASVSAAKR